MGIDTLHGFFFTYDLSVLFYLKNGRIPVKMQIFFFNEAKTLEDIQYILYFKMKC